MKVWRLLMRVNNKDALFRLCACVIFCLFITSMTPDVQRRNRRGRKGQNAYPPVCPPPSRDRHTKFINLPDIFKEVGVGGDNYNIFLIESSCITSLSARIWCAVESVARHNPEAHVWLVMISGTLEEDTTVGSLLSRYPNIHPVTAHPATVLSHTPLHPLYTSQAWNTNTSWPEINLGDLVRLGLVWELGGLYLDSDIVCLRPLTNLANTVAWQERESLGSGAFHFTPRHPVLARIMDIAAQTFEANVWGASGPRAFTRAARDHCDKEVIAGALTRCRGDLTLLPITSFYPVPATVWRTIFTPQRPRPVAQRYPGSYQLHTWRQLSHNYPVVRDSGCIYDQAAKEFCPHARDLATVDSKSY